jgi:hypothetical protein
MVSEPPCDRLRPCADPNGGTVATDRADDQLRLLVNMSFSLVVFSS